MFKETTPSAQLPDEQLDRLEMLLDDPSLDESMRLDEIQGFLCAALSGPQTMPEETWLEDVLGGKDVQNTEIGREAVGLLRSFASALEAELVAGEPPTLLLYPKDDENGPSDYLPWCQAYLAGVDAAEEDWFEFLGEEEDEDEDIREEISYLDERLFPLMVLTGEAEAAAREHGEEWPDGEQLAEVENDCQEDLPQAIVDIYRFWLAKRGTPTIRREEPKTGRNETCPCGSGKKYKQCCGAT